MSYIINVGAVALNQIPLDWKGNLQRIRTAIDMAVDAGVSLLCMPELCITGYGCEDAFFSEYVYKKAQEIVYKLYLDSKDIAFCVGLPIYYNSSLYNAVAFINRDNVYYIPKQNLCADGVHYEPRWFKPWPANEYKLADGIGDQVIDCGGVRIGFEICEDAWVARRPGISLAERSVDIILNPSASHFAFEKHNIRKNFVIEGSRAFRCGYVYANLLGNESGRIIFDGDCFIANCGKLVAEGPRFSFEDVVLTCGPIDIQKIRTAKIQNHSFKPSDYNISNGDELKYNVPLTMEKVISKSYTPHYKKHTRFDEFTLAVSLGLFDYARKSHSNGFVVSLSGGADSAAVAVLVDNMYKTAVNELGEENAIKKLGFSRENLLTCIYQAADNSSDETQHAARDLALSLGAHYMVWGVSDIVKAYEKLVSVSLGRELSWGADDIARQNIQARVRSPGAWMIANIKNALFLSTSNRSEAAVGYATMDGDTSGGLSPIAGIDKQFLLGWLRYYMMIEKNYSKLDNILKLKPSAELRPDKQIDEQDLMPYNVLDAIEKLAIRDKRSPKEIVELGHDKEHVKKFFKLWCRNQWKRERIAVAFHLDDENLDPKTWCRWPVLSSGLIEELEDL